MDAGALPQLGARAAFDRGVIVSLIYRCTDAPDTRRMGGKAAALAELSAAGLPIPPWFVISPEAHALTFSLFQQRFGMERHVESVPGEGENCSWRSE